jgi:putative zinc finger/helix-turn-helix YgiT family protein
MNSHFCPKCEKYVEAYVKKCNESFPVRGEFIEVESSVLYCEKCGNQIFNEEIDERNLQKAYASYRCKHDLLSSQQIKEIRRKYGLSQRSLSRLLGWGDITINRYENGAIQDKAHDNLLRLIADSHNMLDLLHRNPGCLADKASAELEIRIRSAVAAKAGQSMMLCLEDLFDSYVIDEFSGFMKFEIEKFIAMFMFFVANLKLAWKTKINKLLWYADFLHFKEYSCALSGAHYVRLPYGPVPDNYEMIIGYLLSEGSLGKEEVIFGKDKVVEKLVSRTTPDLTIFKESELKVLNYILTEFKDTTSKEISKKSHAEHAFTCTREGQPISYKLAEKLSFSLP